MINLNSPGSGNNVFNTINLLIGGFHISLEPVEKGITLAIDPAWAPFINVCNQDQEIHIRVFNGMPEWITNAVEIFGGLTYENMDIYMDSLPWSIRESEGKRMIITGETDYAAVMDEDCRNFDIYCENSGENNLVFPVIPYPLGPLILYYLAVTRKAAFIHASGVVSEGGFVFTAQSGTGKSTMAKLWEKRGARVVNDDRLLLKIKDDVVMMYNSPMSYPDVPKFAPVNTLCLIHQSNENTVREINGVEAVAKVYAQFIQHAYNNDHVQSLMTLAEDICSRVKVLEVGFNLDGNIVDLLRVNYRSIDIPL